MESTALTASLTVASLALLAYSYAGYPVLLRLLGFARRSEAGETLPGDLPDVSVIFSAYNEEGVIDDRLRNLLSLDYPRERLEILVGSDGSTDRTAAIVKSYRSRGVRFVSFERRRGKASVLNDLVALARGEIVVFTDANTFFEPDALRQLVRALLSRPSASAVVGQVELRSSVSAGNLDGIYWRYETWMKKLESHFGAVLGANGPLYAVHRKRYQPLPGEAIVDDFLIPMLIRLRSGGAIYFVPSARAWEKSPERVRDEFRRHVRIGAGNFQALKWTWRLLLPWEGTVALAYFSHKVLRWFGPWLMLAAFIANLWLLPMPFFRLLFCGQLAFYGLGLGARVVRKVPLLGAAASGMRYFVLLNAALLLGFTRFALGTARPFWNTTPR